jgi:hypothetical protein
MYAERIIVETDQFGQLKNLPKLPANKHLEAIFLVVSNSKEGDRRQPHQDIAGKTRFIGDVISSAPTADWNLL